MNKKIKKIVAMALTISAFCTITPISNLMTTKAYASSSDTKLSSIYLSDGSIHFDSDDTSYNVNVSSSVDEIRITAKPEDSNSTVTIDGTTVDKDDSYRKSVSLDRGDNTIKIKVEDTDGHTRTYYLYVKRGTSSSHDDGDVYLDRLDVSEGSLDFDEDDTSYNVKVDSDVDEIKITAEPEDSYDKVRIDGSTVDEDDDWEKTVSLSKGTNKIEVKVEDDNDSDNTRTYTLYVSRGHSSSTGDSDKYLDELSISGSGIDLSDDKTTYYVTTDESVDNIEVRAELDDDNNNLYINGTKVYKSDDYEKKITLNKGRNEITVQVKDFYGKELKTYTLYVIKGQDNVKASQWVVGSDGLLQYNDASGNPMKNSWFTDPGTAKKYYLDENGHKTLGWKLIGSSWYLFDWSGTMLTGWQQVGWNWYYMDSNGVMAYNTSIDGYRVGSDGAWIR